MTIKEFITLTKLHMDVTQIDERPDQTPEDRDGWQHDASHWRLTLRRAGSDARRTLTVYYSMGSALRGNPELPDVLYSLGCDARDFGPEAETVNGYFSDWCANYGYDSDSRKAERTYRACLQSAKRLRRFLGPDLYAQLLEAEEE